jgi:hypothetical protein
VYKGTVMEVVIAEAREISKKKASAAANWRGFRPWIAFP